MITVCKTRALVAFSFSEWTQHLKFIKKRYLQFLIKRTMNI